MNDADFWAEMWKAPEDDFPRLAYADWLDDLGDGKGAFVRLSCELAQMVPDEAGFAEKLLAEHTLINEEAVEWLTPVFHWAKDFLIHRGMLIPTLAPEELLADAEAIDEVPLFGVRLVDRDRETIHKLAASGLMAKMRSLALPADELLDAPTRKLIRSKDCSRLWSLNVPFIPDAERVWQRMLDEDHLPELRHLTVTRPRQFLGETDAIAPPVPIELLSRLQSLRWDGGHAGGLVRQLSKVKHPLPLQTLHLIGPLVESERTHLFAKPAFEDLTVLQLPEVAFDHRDFERLASGPLSKTLVSLTCRLECDPNANVSFPAQPLPHLKRLRFTRCRLTDNQWKALFRSRLLTDRETLTIDASEPPRTFDEEDFSDTHRPEIDWATLFESLGEFPRLKSLTLTGFRFDEAAIGRLFTPDRFPKLQRLSFVGEHEKTTLDRTVAARLLRTRLPRLTDLSLSVRGGYSADRWFSAESPLLANLTRFQLDSGPGCSGTWSPLRDRLSDRLRCLDLGTDAITADDAEFLLSSPRFEHLHALRFAAVSNNHDLTYQVRRHFADQLAAGNPPLSTSDPPTQWLW